MDVDLLRPGTVPMAPETILWFEFLLDKDLLLKHLQKLNPEPTPTDLISKFSMAIYETVKNEPKKEMDNGEFYPVELSADHVYSAKAKALKILIFKVTAFLKWDLNTFRTLPLKIQMFVLQDLIAFTNDNNRIELPNVPDPKTLESPNEALLFSLIVYHRWVIMNFTFGVNNALNINQRTINTELILAETRQLQESLFSLENVGKSVEYLNSVLTWPTLPRMLSFDCFLVLTEDNPNVEFDLNCAKTLNKEEYLAQINYDLATFYFFKEEYDSTSKHFMDAMKYFKALKNPSGFMTLSLPTLESYLMACNTKGNGHKNTLLHQLRISVASQLTGLLSILQQDNLVREIPIVHRINIELDIVAAISSGKFTVARDLLPKVQALNVLRYVLEDTAVQCNDNNFNADAFVWCLSSLWQHYKVPEKNLVYKYLIELVINGKCSDLFAKMCHHPSLNEILMHPEIRSAVVTMEETVAVPDLLENIQWELYDSNKKRNPNLEIRILEQQILQSYNPQEIKDLLVKLTTKDMGRPNWKLNMHWSLPIPLQSVIMSINRGFWQDFSYILLAKSRELMLKRDWSSAIDLLETLEKEGKAQNTNSTMNKLAKLISWEKLLIQINQLFEEWPCPSLDKSVLIQTCENCLKGNELVLPRTEVMEQSLICLLNLKHWDIVNCIEKRWSNFEVAIAITLTCQDLVKSKGSKKFSKDLWDMVIPIFITNTSKRGNTHHDSPTNNDKIMVLSLFNKLRDSVALSVVISLLTKLYNILKDEASLELNIDNAMMWPAVLSNTNLYNTTAVFEILSEMVTQGLNYYPNNCAWLKLMGDINFVNFKYEKSLCFYLKCLMISTDFFNLQVKPDDILFRRMIKCSLALGCHTQAAILTQFLEEPDYLLSFRCLSEHKSNDAIDSYYHCFWDINILEYLVHVHNKRTEFQRRKRAMQTMGLLELNASNNEEILRESSILRKKSFLRSMCKQYVPL